MQNEDITGEIISDVSRIRFHARVMAEASSMVQCDGSEKTNLGWLGQQSTESQYATAGCRKNEKTVFTLGLRQLQTPGGLTMN